MRADRCSGVLDVNRARFANQNDREGTLDETPIAFPYDLRMIDPKLLREAGGDTARTARTDDLCPVGAHWLARTGH